MAGANERDDRPRLAGLTLPFWITPGMFGVLERRAIAVLSLVCLAPWLVACVTDVNHPPGVRYVRLAAAAVTLALAALEYSKAWRGVLLFNLLWPYGLVFQDSLCRVCSPLFAVLPMFWSGPAAAALCFAIALRTERAERDGTARAVVPSRWSTLARMAGWLLLASWAVSAVAAEARIALPPPEWLVETSDPRHLLVLTPRGSLTPLLMSLDILPAILLGLAIWNCLSRGAQAPPLARFLWINALNGCMIAGIIVSQCAVPWHWPFDASPPSGPFANRNTAAPVIVLMGLSALVLQAKLGGRRRVLVAAATACILATTCLLGSRNGLLMLCAFALVLLLQRRTWLSLGILSCLATIVFAAVAWLPIERFRDLPADTLPQRLVATVEGIRIHDWRLVTGGRHGVFRAAWEIFKRYPATGSGPGTTAMLLHSQSRLGQYIVEPGQPYPVFYSMHSMPLQLLAECGLAAMASWVVLWVVLPLLAVLKSRSAVVPAALPFIAGVGDVFDAVWLVPGVTAFCVLLLVFAGAEVLFATKSTKMSLDSPSCSS